MSQSPILIVDTNEPARILLKAYLQRLGFKTIDESSDSMDALRQMMSATQDDKPYTVVFLEWTMPEMGAVEFLQATRQMGSFKNSTIIVMGEEYDEKKWERVIGAGANAYLFKPVTEDSLLAAMAKFQMPRPQKSE